VAQIKIYGLREFLPGIRTPLSDTIHACVVEALQIPPDKRFYRFFPMKRIDFIFPPDRSDRYTIIEISIFEGRSDETKRALLNLLMTRIPVEIGIPAQDIEITIFETPVQNWGIRGKVADELELSYKVEV
jgi:phenylpyruvate tautomerase PptA (4-oxalocrotonate tautomerase family)